MEAHRSYERFEQGRHVAASEELPRHAQKAALAVAVIAGFLAVATFLSNEALKEVITDAAAKARELETRVVERLRPTDVHLEEEIRANRSEVDHANDRHLALELAEVGFEIGIVLASVSIIARRPWLLGGAAAAALAGAALLAVGLLIA
jgi:hypothetical protein